MNVYFMYRGIILRIKIFVILGILITSIIQCGKLEGEFAFKYLFDDAYRKIIGVPEFNNSEEVNWVYIFKKIRGYHLINIVVMKKEIIWVDIDSRIENIGIDKNIIYGKIKDLDEGRYKIIISKEGKIIDQKEFIVFTEDDEVLY